jgi:hypothetical protein
VQLWLGHHSAAFTLRVYVHLLPSDLPEPPAAFDQMAQGGNDISRAKPVDAVETAV